MKKFSLEDAVKVCNAIVDDPVEYFSGLGVVVVDDNFDMNNTSPGIYRSWGKKPINAPNQCLPWAKYFVIPFVEGDSDFMFQVAIDSNGNMFIRTRGGSPAAWNLWHMVNLG